MTTTRRRAVSREEDDEDERLKRRRRKRSTLGWAGVLAILLCLCSSVAEAGPFGTALTPLRARRSRNTTLVVDTRSDRLLNTPSPLVTSFGPEDDVDEEDDDAYDDDDYDSSSRRRRVIVHKSRRAEQAYNEFRTKACKQPEDQGYEDYLKWEQVEFHNALRAALLPEVSQGELSKLPSQQLEDYPPEVLLIRAQQDEANQCRRRQQTQPGVYYTKEERDLFENTMANEVFFNLISLKVQVPINPKQWNPVWKGRVEDDEGGRVKRSAEESGEETERQATKDLLESA